jgi:hypothetical protein
VETLKRKSPSRKLQLDADTIRCAEASTEPDILFALARGKGNGGNGVAQ